MNTKETKKSIIQAGRRAVEELIKVAKEAIKAPEERKEKVFKGFAEGRSK